jgi:hypothetical protein
MPRPQPIAAQIAAASFTGLCEQGSALAEMLTRETAARLSDFSEREIFRLIENGRLHFTEAERIFVCRNSLMNTAESFE